MIIDEMTTTDKIEYYKKLLELERLTLAAVTEQRDRLAEALCKVIDPRCSDREKFIHAGNALAAVEGGKP